MRMARRTKKSKKGLFGIEKIGNMQVASPQLTDVRE